jgi:hypothetical protein
MHVCKPCDRLHVVQNQVQEALVDVLRTRDKAEFSNKEDLLSQNFLTVADSMRHLQDRKTKGQIENINRTQKDIQGCGSGAAGHGVNLAQWVQQARVRSGHDVS